MKFRNKIECEIDVNFVDHEKAKGFFIDSDWKDCFFKFVDLEEVAEYLALAFHNSPESTDEDGRFKCVDGFGEYFYSHEDKVWRLTDRYLPQGGVLPCGEITIRYESALQCSQTDELDG